MSVLSIQTAMHDLSAPLGEARGLPNVCYIDRDYHRMEGEQLFARGWTCVGVGAEIPDAGDVRPVEVAGRPVLLARDTTGSINAYHNVCSHRGVRLVAEAQQRQAAIRCPYHSWTYALDGTLIRTPMVGGTDVHHCPGVNKADLGLKPILVSIWNDLVFVDLSSAAPPLTEIMAPLDARWAAYDFSGIRHAASWQLELRANWKLAIENFLESYHLPWVHPALNGRSPLEQHRHVVISDRHFGQITEKFAVERIANSPFVPFPGLTETQEQSGEYPIIFPNVMLGLQRDHFYCIIAEPVATDRTRERVHLYMVGDKPDDAAYDAAVQGLVEDWKAVFAEDVWAVERMQMGRMSSAFDGGVLTPHHDDLTRLFMQKVIEALVP